MMHHNIAGLGYKRNIDTHQPCSHVILRLHVARRTSRHRCIPEYVAPACRRHQASHKMRQR